MTEEILAATPVDPAVAPGSPAATSRGYAIGAARIFSTPPTIPAGAAAAASLAYNAELVKQLSPTMKAVIHNLALP